MPAYNVSKYIETAIDSCVYMPQVREIIVVEDGSPDQTWEMCQKLDAKFDKIKLYRHENGKNKGAAETRNVAIKQATQEYIAFLDADDWFLPHRFDVDAEIFENFEVDGVYSAILASYDIKRPLNKQADDLTTVGYESASVNLFSALLGVDKRGFSHFSLDGLTVKREALIRCNISFNTLLRLHQDSHFCLQMAYHLKLVPGSIVEPVSRYRVHAENRITANSALSPAFMKNKQLFWSELRKWTKDKKLKSKERMMIYLNYKLYSLESSTSRRGIVYRLLIELHRTIATRDYRKMLNFLVNQLR